MTKKYFYLRLSVISGQNSKIWEYRRQRIFQKSTKSESENLRNRFGFFGEY